MSPIRLMHAITVTAFLQLPVVNPDSASAQSGKSSSEHPDQQRPSIPTSLVMEHEELHEHLARLFNSGGKTEAAAREVGKLLHPHFVKEEQFAMPPLGLLSVLASGEVPANAENVITMADRLKAEMPEMLREHKEIVAALQRLRAAAQDEKNSDAIQFSDDLIAHATQEEQVLYPAAILVGEYLKLKR